MLRRLRKRLDRGYTLLNARLKRAGTTDSTGYTIVEIMIVLAIAGIIMSVAFLAVPQLQRNSRDSQRQSVVEVIHSEMETYAANNTGKYPLSHAGSTTCGSTKSGDFADFYCNYISNGTVQYKDDKDPTTKQSIFVNSANPTASKYVPVQCGVATAGTQCSVSLLPNKGEAQIFVHAKCNGSQAISIDGVIDPNTATSINTRSFAIVVGLDRSSSYFCVDNS